MTNVPVWAQDSMTDNQRGFIFKLIDERELVGDVKDRLLKTLRIAEDPEEPNISKSKASEIITWLLEQPKSKAHQFGQQDMPEVPAGRYAVESNEGELRFYKLWIGRTGYKKLYVLHGPDESAIPFKAMNTILGKIAEDVHGAAVRYGQEIGACSQCGRRLTNRISRELGIGPICGGRVWTDDWKGQVKAARQRILDRGEDPEEELE